MTEEKDTKEGKRAKLIKNARRLLLRIIILIPPITIFIINYRNGTKAFYYFWQLEELIKYVERINEYLLEWPGLSRREYIVEYIIKLGIGDVIYHYLLPIVVISISSLLIIDYLTEALDVYQAGNKKKAKCLIICTTILLLPITFILGSGFFPWWWRGLDKALQITILSTPIPLFFLLEELKVALQAENKGKTKGLITGIIILLFMDTFTLWIHYFRYLQFRLQFLITISCLYLILDFLREVIKFPVIWVETEKEKIFGKLNVKLFIVLIFAGIGLWQLNTPPKGAMYGTCEICHSLSWSEYREMKRGIRGLITEKDVDIQSLESMIFPKDNNEYHWDLKCTVSRTAVGHETIYYCNSGIGELYSFLQRAYNSVQNNEKIAAQLILWRADIYLIFHPFCFYCNCDNVPVYYKETVFFP